jgi:hypothetical protein
MLVCRMGLACGWHRECEEWRCYRGERGVSSSAYVHDNTVLEAGAMAEASCILCWSATLL